MTPRHFTFQEGTSHKFWEITLDGMSFTTRYGKVGTAGQSTTKTCGSAAEAEKEVQRLIAEKTRKGYRASETVEARPVDTSSVLLSAADIPAAFRDHFAYLVDSPGYGPVLEAISKRAVSARQVGADLVVAFDETGEKQLFATPPTTKAFKGWPEAFRKLMGRHEFLAFPEKGWALWLGDTGSVEGDVEELPVLREVLCDYSDWWVVGPGKSPELALLSHESGDLAETTSLNPGALFLKRLAENLDLANCLPSEVPEAEVGEPVLLPECSRLEAPESSCYGHVDGAPDWLVAQSGGPQGATLLIYDASQADLPRLLGQCEIPAFVGTSFGYVKIQKVGTRLFLGGSRGYVEVDVTDPAHPAFRRSFLVDACRCCHWFSDDEVVFQYYLTGEDTREQRLKRGASPQDLEHLPVEDALFRQPLGGGAETITRVGEVTTYGHDSLKAGGLVLFQNQKGFDLYDPTTHKRIPGKRFGMYWPRLAALPGAAAVLETGDRDNFALRLVDLSGKKPELGDKHFRKMDAAAWCLEGDRFWVILGRDTRSKECPNTNVPRYSLGVLRLGEGLEEACLPLPDELPWHKLEWMKVSEGHLAVLFDDGTLRRLALPGGPSQARS